jgi:hypothetical protein
MAISSVSACGPEAMLALIMLVVMAYVFSDQLHAAGIISSLQLGFLLTCVVLLFFYRRRGTDL